MPTESLTFSSAVDEVMAESGRPDKRALIADYVNTSIREAQTNALYSNDMVEDIIVPTADPNIWDKPRLFRKMKYVKYANSAGYTSATPEFITPGKGQIDKSYYYYGTGGSFAFVGSGSNSTDQIKVAYYEYLRRLVYYPLGQRPARWFVENDAWAYYDLTSIGLLDYTQLANQKTARDLVQNWMLARHYDCAKEGGLAKIFKNIADQQRSAMAFSLFSTLKDTVLNSEANESLSEGG